MELIDIGKILAIVVVGALVVYGTWALIILGFALARGWYRDETPLVEPPRRDRPVAPPPTAFPEEPNAPQGQIS